MIVRAAQRPLKVTWVATKAVPFVNNGEKGLAEVIGIGLSALTKLGVYGSLVAPMFRQTAEAIKRDGHRLEDVFPLKFEIGYMTFEPMVRKLDAPFTHSYPVYFIEHAQLFDRPEMYGKYEDNLTRFSVLGLAAIHLSHKMGEAPDIFDVHEHQGAHTAVYLDRFRHHPRNDQEQALGDFFKNTKIAFGIHAPNFKGEINPNILAELGLSWPNMLTAGLKTADISYARSLEFITRAVEGNTAISRVLREELEANRLVGLVEHDRDWDPTRTLTPKLALEAAKRFLGVYRHLATHSFGNAVMEEAKQTVPPLHWEILTPREIIAKLNPEASRLYDNLPEEDKNIIDTEVYSGRIDCFKRVKNKIDLEIILNLLKIEPVCDINKMLRDAAQEVISKSKSKVFEKIFKEIEGFIDEWVSAGDINRLLSSKIDLSISENRLITRAFGNRGKISLYEALEKLGVMPHVIKLFLSLKVIAAIKDLSVSEIEEILSERGLPDEADDKETPGIISEINEFRLFSDIYHRLARDPSTFRSFILGALLHDIGDFVEHETHPERGLEMLEDLKILKLLLDEKQLEFVRNIVLFHSTFSDSVVTGELNPHAIDDIYKAYRDEEESRRDLLLDALLLFGGVDMDAKGERGRLTPYKIKKLFQVHKAVITAPDINGLKKNKADLGLAPNNWGVSQWNHWIQRRIDNKEQREKSKDEGIMELVNYARRTASLMSRGEVMERLGLMINIWGMEDLINVIDNARHRARLIIRIVELSKDMKRLKFRMIPDLKDQTERLSKILEKSDFSVEDTKRDFRVDVNEKRQEVIISLPPSPTF